MLYHEFIKLTQHPFLFNDSIYNDSIEPLYMESPMGITKQVFVEQLDHIIAHRIFEFDNMCTSKVISIVYSHTYMIDNKNKWILDESLRLLKSIFKRGD